MARGVTQDEVNTAIEQIIADGERPTIERVRAMLGTGSPNTLTRMLSVWWQGLGERLAEKHVSVAIPEAPKEVNQAASELWKLAIVISRDITREEVHKERQQLSAERAALQNDRESLRDVAAAAVTRAESSELRLEASEARVGDLQRHIGSLEQRIEALMGSQETLQRERDELQSQIAQAYRAREEQSASSAAALKELEAGHRRSEDRWLRQIDELNQQRSATKKELKAKASKIEALQREAAELAKNSSKRAAEVDRREAALSAKIGSLEAEVLRLHDQLSRLASRQASQGGDSKRRKPKIASQA